MKYRLIPITETEVSIIDGDRGKNYPKKNELLDEGYCIFLNTKNVTKNGLVFNETLFIDEAKDQALRKGKLSRGDIVLTTRGTVGNFGYYDDSVIYEKMRINSGMVILRNNDSNILTDYLYWLLKSSFITNQINSLVSGSAQPQLPISSLNKVELIIPPLDVQREIAKIIVTINEKIRINNLLIKKLEIFNMLLFKHWFIDFDFPNEEGQPYKSSGGKMAESELGMIPEEWEVKTLTDIANYKNGLAMQKYRPIEGGETLPVLKIKELNEGTTSSKSDLCTSNINEEVKVYDGDVIFSWSGTLMVKLWSGGNAGLNQHLFKVTSTNSPKWLYYLWTSYHLDKFIGIAKDKATTMGHINRKHLEESLIVVPSDLKSNDIFRVFNSLIEQQISLGLENRKLTKLRDTLLPKLLSGEIEVPVKEAESV